MGHQSILLTSSAHKATIRRRRPKRIDSSSDRLMQAIFQRDSALTDVDNEFLLAAEAGDLTTVQRAVQDYNVNINCADHMGRSALELALIGENQAVVEYLLPRSNLQCIEDALLYAISKDNVKMSELILNHPLYNNHRFQTETTAGVYQQDSDTPRLRSTSTPVILAAHRNNFYILQLLISRGAKITPPHDYFCDCIECSNMRGYDSVKYSRSRLNTFRALASSAYISLSAEDPILTAFKLSHQLERLSEIEKEYKPVYQELAVVFKIWEPHKVQKNLILGDLVCHGYLGQGGAVMSEYKSLSEQCKDYAVELLELCQSRDEIIAILNEDGDDPGAPADVPNTAASSTSLLEDDNFSLARVKLALKYEQKRFIAHATCQRQLISLWYSGIPWMRHQHMIVKLLSVPVAMVLLPFATIVFLIAPKSKCGKIMRSPFVKFLNHTCAYIIFLILVFMSCLRNGSGNTWQDMACYGITNTQPFSIVFILILVWVLGMFLHECRQLWREGPKDYVTDWWNWMDSSLILLYLAYYGIVIVIYVKISYLLDVALTYGEMDQLRDFCPGLEAELTCRTKVCIVEAEERNLTWWSNGCRNIEELYSPPGKSAEINMLSDMNQIADIFFSLANVLSFARIAHLLPANEQLGPLLVSFGRMLHDVARFGIVFMLVFLAFLCGLTSLYRVHQCENIHFSRVDFTLSSLFWATFGMGDMRATMLDHRLLSSHDRLVTAHSTHFPLTVLVGYALFWTYIVAAVVVMLNMLIAMMSNSFQEIYDDRDVEWKFARAKLWSDFFEDGCTLPTPFNLIPNPKYLVRIAIWCIKRCRGTREDPPVQMAYIYTRRKNGMVGEELSDIQLPQKPETMYKRVTRKLVQRIVYKRQSEFVDKLAKENELEEIKADLSNLTQNVDKLRHDMTQMKSNAAHKLRTRNGFSATGTPRSRTELHV